MNEYQATYVHVHVYSVYQILIRSNLCISENVCTCTCIFSILLYMPIRSMYIRECVYIDTNLIKSMYVI